MADGRQNRFWFLKIFRKYTSGTATTDEKAFVEQYLKDLEHQPGESATSQALSQSVARARRQLLRNINEEESKQLPKGIVVTLNRYGWAAASVLVMFAAGAWFFLKQKQQPQKTTIALKNELHPGRQTALLTLSDGSTIVLDSVANGRLAIQGASTVIKLANGRLQYRPGTLADETETVYNTIQTPRGGQYNITLPDGTAVWMNAASSIKFPTAFTGNYRIVETSGELYFEVAKNATQPFKVMANNTEIDVLGTSFNINSYPDEASATTTLLQGSVIISGNGSRPVKIRPGQQAVVRGTSPGAEIKEGANMEEVLAWKNGYFIFNRTDIQTVMRQIGRWYDVDVSYEGPVPSGGFVGKIPMHATASQVLKVLEEMDVHFRIEGRRIIVSR